MKCIGCHKETYKGSRYCHSCRKRQYKEKYPEKYAYQVLRNNAKRRNKEFTLTFQQFISFCTKTEYFEKKGTSKTSYHIDRIDETKGYTIDNIQVLTNTENVRKYLKWSYRDENGRDVFTVSMRKEDKSTDDVPF